MKRSGTPFRILLAHPPAVSPAMPSWDNAVLASRFADSNLRVAHYDANLDFYRRYCLDPKRLLGWFDRIDDRRKAGEYEDAGADIQRALDQMERRADWWRNRLAAAEGIIHRVGSREFMSPLTSIGVFRHIEDLMQIVSMAHFPIRIQWGRAALPQIVDEQTAEGLLEATDVNPFWDCYRRFMEPYIGHPDLKHVIVTVRESAQAFAGWTMARYIKSESPNLEVTLFGPLRLIRYASGDADHMIESDDDHALARFVGRFLPSNSGAISTMPDFSGLPLQDYLSPERVFPLAWIPDGSTVREVCTHLGKRYGATAFYSRSETLFERLVNIEPGRPASDPPTYRISLPCRLTPQIDPDRLARAEPFGVRQIRWRFSESIDSAAYRLLRPASRRGVWNHITLETDTDADAILLADPTTVHSWDYEPKSVSPLTGTHRRRPTLAQGYRSVQPLPGRPYWQEIAEPMTLFTLLGRRNTRTITRWRIADDPVRRIELGTELQYHFKPPGELPEGYLDELCRMVEAGGSVGLQWVRHNLERAFLIAYATEQGVIVANSSLKHPRQEYIEKLEHRSGIDVRGYLERGYTSVRPEYRGLGIGTRLLDGLTRRAGDRKIFSIIDEDNRATQKIAIRNRTRKVATFYSEQLEKTVGVWMPEWMIDE